jgi:hypothetical protein
MMTAACMVAADAGISDARAQMTGSGVPALAGFRQGDNAPIGPSVQRFDPAPASGAGRTGFDSTNARKKQAVRNAARNSSSASGSVRDAPSVNAETRPVAPPPSAYQRPMPPLSSTAKPADGTQAMAAQLPVTPVGAQPPRVTKRKKIAAEGDPYDPLGIRAGAFDLYPAIELYGGYDSNPAARPTGSGSSLLTLAPELRVQSRWSRHELKADLRGTYTAYAKDTTPSVSRPQATGSVDGRIDVTRDTRIDLGGRLQVGTDYPNSPNLQAGLSRLPIYTTLGGIAGLAHRFNRLEVGIKGTLDRTVWQQSSLVDGTTASNDDRNFNQYGAVLRAGYELRPGITPYVEAGGDSRVHDLAADAFGYRRNSKAMTGRVGSTFELSRQLTGDISVGYTRRNYDDARLKPASGLLFDASLLWTATPLTTAKLTAKTSVGESTVPGVSGIFYRDVGLQVDHAMRRWLIATVKFGFGFDTYQGDDAAGTIADRQDTRYALGFGLTYKFNRDLWLKGEVRREWLRSNATGFNYDANIFLLGLRLQK